MRINNKSGFKGVHKYGNKYRAAININGKIEMIGAFTTPEEASEVYIKKAKEVYGEFFRA